MSCAPSRHGCGRRLRRGPFAPSPAFGPGSGVRDGFHPTWREERDSHRPAVRLLARREGGQAGRAPPTGAGRRPPARHARLGAVVGAGEAAFLTSICYTISQLEHWKGHRHGRTFRRESRAFRRPTRRSRGVPRRGCPRRPRLAAAHRPVPAARTAPPRRARARRRARALPAFSFPTPQDPPHRRDRRRRAPRPGGLLPARPPRGRRAHRPRRGARTPHRDRRRNPIELRELSLAAAQPAEDDGAPEAPARPAGALAAIAPEEPAAEADPEAGALRPPC